MSSFLAYLFSFLIILSALRVVTCIKPVHALLAMLVCLLSLSGLFFVIGAPFAGAIEMIVYAGAIMVLFVFILMILNLGKETYQAESELLNAKTWVLPAAFATIIFIALSLALLSGNDAVLTQQVIETRAIGLRLYGPYVILVQAGALILLAALVAAYHIAKNSNAEQNEVLKESTEKNHE